MIINDIFNNQGHLNFNLIKINITQPFIFIIILDLNLLFKANKEGTFQYLKIF